ARITDLTVDYLENIPELIEPSGSCVNKDLVLVYGSSTVIEGPSVFQSEVVSRLLERCDKVAVFIVTLGSYLEEMVQCLAEDKLILQATVLDAIGSAAVEVLVESVRDRIKRSASIERLGVSRYFGPGHCDWDVSQQEVVFQALDGNHTGVQLADGYLMLPQKSASGIIGIGPASEVEAYDPCGTCQKQDCPGRR
ncbi:MAG: vitamin B12 dependent-methionine synthase activation domain-containing protein, partial [Dehalococcoidia bacterium]